jgi:hypothetical protein
MIGFKTYITEGKYPIWLRVSVGALVIKIRNLNTQIENEKDPIKQNKLISKQNTLLSYISGLGIGVGSSDKVLLRKMKSSSVGKK